MKKKLLLFLVCLIAVRSYSQFTKTNYITLSPDGKFMDGSTEFKPLFLNYLINFPKDVTQNDRYLSPCYNYSDIWGFPNTDNTNGRFVMSVTNDRLASRTKLLSDLDKIKAMGFNVVRTGPGITWENGIVRPQEGDFESYFSLMEEYISLLKERGLRMIWVLEANKEAYLNPEQYKAFLETVSIRFKNERTIMGYVLFAEPFHTFVPESKNDKLLIANWAREWYYLMKKNAPNHLLTFGIQHHEGVLNWDPYYLTSDFISHHFYAENANVNYSNNLIAVDYKWLSNNPKYPWVMGETGYSGTAITANQDYATGTALQQKDFAEFNMQRALDCGCKGVSWWQYQEVNWGINYQDHFGLYTPYPNEQLKPAAAPFANYSNLTPTATNCVQPSNYYNIKGYTNVLLSGRVVDDKGFPVKDAVVMLTKDYGGTDWRSYKTFTNATGNFTLYGETGGVVANFMISHMGYSVVKASSVFQNATYTIVPIRYNNWMNMWTNDADSKLNTWTIEEFDKFYPGDYDGDGKEELVCSRSNGSAIRLYHFDNGKWSAGSAYTLLSGKLYTGDFDGDGKDELLRIDGAQAILYGYNNDAWQVEWTNSGSGWLSGWSLGSSDKFVVGDYDGDGKDELMCINSAFANIHKFQNGNWVYGWTNNGDVTIGEWTILTNDNFYAGDFDGDGKDELLCVQMAGTNNDWITSLRFNGSWTRQWSNNGSNSHGLYPYKGKLVIGNFDTDPQDEILGVAGWTTKFDFSNGDFVWNWSSGGDRLSDWTPNSLARTFAIKTLKHAPDYLFTVDKKVVSTQNKFHANMYSMNYLIQGITSTLKSGNDQMTAQDNLSENEFPDNVLLYPNPNNGLFNIELNSATDDVLNIEIYNELGQRVSSVEKNLSEGGNYIEIARQELNPGVYFISLKSREIQSVKKVIVKK